MYLDRHVFNNVLVFTGKLPHTKLIKFQSKLNVQKFVLLVMAEENSFINIKEMVDPDTIVYRFFSLSVNICQHHNKSSIAVSPSEREMRPVRVFQY
jgi:hypothetical protein